MTSLTLWRPAAFGDFREKKHLNARGFAQEYLRSCSGIDLVEASKDAASLLVCTRKKFFAWGMRVFCE